MFGNKVDRDQHHVNTGGLFVMETEAVDGKQLSQRLWCIYW